MAAVGPRQEVASLQIPPTIRNKLLCAGFRTTGDLEGVGPVDLATEAQLSHEEALLVLKLALPMRSQGGLDGALSAKQILEREAAARRVITFCSELDAILGGGVATSQITEFCGVPGVGKTQLGMQLAIDVQIPQAFGGIEGEAVYIDTEGSFMLERCLQMVDAAIAHLRRLAESKADPARQAAAAALSREGMLSRVHYFRVRDHIEQLAAVELLPSFLARHPAVRLVVMDSVTFHFRQDFADMAQRTRQLAQMAQQLMQLAGRQEVAVVLMNQVTTKIVGGRGAVGGGGGGGLGGEQGQAQGGQQGQQQQQQGEQQGQQQQQQIVRREHARLVPALGDSWAHSATSRVILYWEQQHRKAFIYKSPTQPPAAAEYHITAEGVRSAKRSSKRPRAV